ncbi:putative nuclease HARBI1 [Tanacetum coccineum]
MCDDGIKQLLAQANEFIIEELNDDAFSQLLLMLAEKELRDEAERSSRLRIQRGREEGHRRLVADYFCDEPVFPPCKFRRRFRMNKVLFMKIIDALSDHYVYFKQRRNALGIKDVIKIFGLVYLRRPNVEDVERILHLHSEYHGFPGMLGSIDCMHWPWKNYPVSWQGQFTRGDHGEPTIMLEAVASQDL